MITTPKFLITLNLHRNLFILITGIYNFRYKESAIFQILLILKCRKNLFLSFFIFSFIPCTSQIIGLNPKIYLAFLLFSESRALGFTFKFKTHRSFRDFSVKLLVARVRDIDPDMFYVHHSACEKTARLWNYDLKNIQIEAFYSFFFLFLYSFCLISLTGFTISVV